MEQTVLAKFSVTITSAEHASWQGHVEIDGVKNEFHSELQLLRCVLEKCPALNPNIKWEDTCRYDRQ